jgi:hypothetical protein
MLIFNFFSSHHVQLLDLPHIPISISAIFVEQNVSIHLLLTPSPIILDTGQRFPNSNHDVGLARRLSRYCTRQRLRVGSFQMS